LVKFCRLTNIDYQSSAFLFTIFSKNSSSRGCWECGEPEGLSITINNLPNHKSQQEILHYRSSSSVKIYGRRIWL